MRLVTLLLASLCGVACSSTYQPVRSSRLSIMWDGQHPAYVKDGRKYEGGIFGGDLDEAVKGSPEAERHARTYRNLLIVGMPLQVVGVVSIGPGTALLASSGGSDDDTQRTVGWGLTLGGVALLVAGVVCTLNAVPHLYDAVNTYNDSQLPENPAPQPAIPQQAPAAGAD